MLNHIIVPFEKAKLTVPVDLTPWPENRYERISVNSFGIGGANAHVRTSTNENFSEDYNHLFSDQ